jgi:hypothetical protein
MRQLKFIFIYLFIYRFQFLFLITNSFIIEISQLVLVGS